MTSDFVRWSILAVPLLVIAGCTPPPPEAAGPEVDGGYTRDGRARAFIDAQLGSHPNGTEPGMTGEEASVIYRNYLRSIGRQAGTGGQQGVGGQSGPGGGGGGGGGVPIGTSGGGGSSP